MNPKNILQILGELRVMPFFPNDTNVMAALLRLVGNMCHSEQQVRWLVARMTSGIYSNWPGDREMRAVFCFRYKPKDGIEAYSGVYPDGLPPDPTAPPRIEAPTYKALPPGHELTADPELEVAIHRAAKLKSMPPARELWSDQFAKMLRNVVTAPQDRPVMPAYEPISAERRAEIQAQIEEAVQRNRAAKGVR